MPTRTLIPAFLVAPAVLTNVDAPTTGVAYKRREWLTQGRN